MGLFTSINIAATGMSVERLRTDVISNNIANATSTRTQEGGAYRRQSVVVEPIASKNPQWRFPFVDKDMDNGAGSGVRVRNIVKDREEWFTIHPIQMQFSRVRTRGMLNIQTLIS